MLPVPRKFELKGLKLNRAFIVAPAFSATWKAKLLWTGIATFEHLKDTGTTGHVKIKYLPQSIMQLR